MRSGYKIAACKAGMTGCNQAWVKSVRRRSRATACKKAAGRAERGRKDRGLVKAADKRLAVSQVRAKAGQVDKAVPVAVAGKGPAAAVVAALAAEVVVVGKNKCGPAGAK